MNLISQHPAELILDVGNDLFDDVVDVFILEGAANILEGEVKGDRFIARFNLFARIDIEDPMFSARKAYLSARPP